MTRLLATLVFAIGLTVIAGCGGTEERATPPPSERQSLDRTARVAFEQGRYNQAATLYAAVLSEALAGDAPEPIVDARFNLALCHTYLGDYDAALAEAASAEAELARRGLPVTSDLRLLIGTIHYRAGDSASARQVLDSLMAVGGLDAEGETRARFVMGLIAADSGDRELLKVQVDAMRPTGDRPADVDYVELRGLLAGQDGDIDAALSLLDEAVLRRGLEADYRGMARALASAGTLSADAGFSAKAAGYFFRAGRSAAQRGQPEAGAWLQRARVLAEASGDEALAHDATALIDSLER